MASAMGGRHTLAGEIFILSFSAASVATRHCRDLIKHANVQLLWLVCYSPCFVVQQQPTNAPGVCCQVVISVVDHHQRPAVPEVSELPAGLPAASPKYLELMQQCWDTLPERRPGFEAVIGHLRYITVHWLTPMLGPGVHAKTNGPVWSVHTSPAVIPGAKVQIWHHSWQILDITAGLMWGLHAGT